MNGTPQTGLTLPGSPAFYAYQNTNKTGELLDNVTLVARSPSNHRRCRSVAALVGWLYDRRPGRRVSFNNVVTFALDQPSYFSAQSIEQSPIIQQPDFNRSYRYTQYFLFAQDTYKLTSRLTVNYGLRYEFYGGPLNVGAAKDTLVQLGSGSTLAQQLVNATLATPSGSGDQKLFGSDKGDFAVRAGAAYDLFGSGRTLLAGRIRDLLRSALR